MTSNDVRQSFLDFFAAKGHHIVPSAPLLPSSPNLLFTNAGMNPFVPYFLGERDAPHPRVADTQKCIRAGGKHNDLDDVGYDTYHQTFFEMLGNWSFGDYFKAEAIEWAWELLTTVWGFPKNRLYASVYKPGEGDPAEFDQEAYDLWKNLFEKEGLDPAERIVFGNKKDNFWMMGDTGPCGPCSEIHIDLTPNGDSGGKLVNADSPWCIEIWNLVFMQYNATEDGRFVPLAAKHVDTGMGFERVAGILATTQNFTDFSKPPSNYNADLFHGIFAVIEELSGLSYGATLPVDPSKPTPEEERDIVFRVLGDHIRTLCCAIADGILPGNEGRNYVLRRILRRAVMYGRRLNLKPGFFAELVVPTLGNLGGTFSELRKNEDIIRKVIAAEEAAFDRTLDQGMKMFLDFINFRERENEMHRIDQAAAIYPDCPEEYANLMVVEYENGATEELRGLKSLWIEGNKPASKVSGSLAFTLYDTYGFPLDLTDIIAREHGLAVDHAAFEDAMADQRQRARDAQKKSVITVAGDEGDATEFIGFDPANWTRHATRVVTVVEANDGKRFLVTESTPFYAEMGGQIGDRGQVDAGRTVTRLLDCVKDASDRHLHRIEGDTAFEPGQEVFLSLDIPRRRDIQRHHSATHILNWALRETLGDHVRQAGSFVGPDRLRFDFNHFEALGADQLQEIERLVNEQLFADQPVITFETAFEDKPDDVIAVFGEKYGNTVRVVDIGGWSKELCGGTHVERVGEIGQIRLVAESSISAGVRRIEAVCGSPAREVTAREHALLSRIAGSLSVKPEEAPARLDTLLAKVRDLEKELKDLKSAAARGKAADLTSQVQDINGMKVLAARLDGVDANGLREAMDGLRVQLDPAVIVLAGSEDGKVFFNVSVAEACQASGVHAGKLAGALAKQCGGGGGGKADRAQAGGKDPAKLDDALATIGDLLG